MPKRSMRLASGTVMMLFAGIIYAWSILKAPLAAEFGWNSTQLGLNYTVTMGSFCIGNILCGILIKRLSPRVLTLIGAVITCAGFILSAQNQGSLTMLYITYGFMCGTGIGIVYNTIITTVSTWFADKRATASGALMMGFGFSSLFLGAAAGKLIDAIGWRNCYSALGISIFIVLFLGSFFMKPCSSIAEGTAANHNDISPGQMVRKASFLKFYLFLVLLGALGNCVISLAKDISLAAGATETLSVYFVGLLSVSNGAGRILFGRMLDRRGRRRSMVVAGSAGIISMLFSIIAVTQGSVVFLFLSLVFVGLTYGSVPTVTSGYVSKSYGLTHFSINFSIANTMLMISSFAATIGGMILISTGSFVPVFVMLLIFAAAALVIALTMGKLQSRSPETIYEAAEQE